MKPSSTLQSSPPQPQVSVLSNSEPSQHRTRQLVSAWLTLVPSKAITLLIQSIAIPTVYRAIGPEQFAAYAAVTASVTILSFLNLGMGGALVTPMAQAVAERNHQQEANLFGATLIPIIGLSALALFVALPLLWLLPPRVLFGLAATATGPHTLRLSALFACTGAIAAVPLSMVDSARQAYQEMHISNLFGLLTNVLLCVGLLLTAWFLPTLPAFVAATAFAPLTGRLLNAALLFVRRPYLVTQRWEHGLLRLARHQAADGLSYMGAAFFASVLVYQWPVYYMARVRPPRESSTFAVYLQVIVLALSLGVSMAQPLWAALADATARADRAWVARVVLQARAAALAYGVCALLTFGLMMNVLLRAWLHRPIQMPPAACWLAGAYLLLASWESVHWPLALGLGAMRAASGMMFWRAVAFAVSVPLVVSHGVVGLMAALCGSVIAISAWYCPVLLARILSSRVGEGRH